MTQTTRTRALAHIHHRRAAHRMHRNRGRVRPDNDPAAHPRGDRQTDPIHASTGRGPDVDGLGSDHARVSGVPSEFGQDTWEELNIITPGGNYGRGETLRAVPVADPTTATDYDTGEYGRIRDVAHAPDGSLWFLTSNTDNYGTPSEGDDRILRIELGQ